MTNVIPVTQARRDLLKLVDQMDEDTQVGLTKRGKIKAVLVSPEYLEGLKETAEILAIPGARESIKRGEEQIKRGEFISLDDLLK